MSKIYSFRYRICADDLFAFLRFFRHRHRTSHLSGILVGGTLIGLLVYLFIRSPTTINQSLIVGIVVAVVVSLLLFKSDKSKVNRAVAKQMADPTVSFEREAFLGSEGFREITEITDSFHAWNDFECIGITQRHVFLQTNWASAFILSTAHLSEEALELLKIHIPAGKLVKYGAEPIVGTPPRTRVFELDSIKPRHPATADQSTPSAHPSAH